MADSSRKVGIVDQEEQASTSSNSLVLSQTSKRLLQIFVALAIGVAIGVGVSIATHSSSSNATSETSQPGKIYTRVPTVSQIHTPTIHPTVSPTGTTTCTKLGDGLCSFASVIQTPRVEFCDTCSTPTECRDACLSSGNFYIYTCFGFTFNVVDETCFHFAYKHQEYAEVTGFDPVPTNKCYKCNLAPFSCSFLSNGTCEGSTGSTTESCYTSDCNTEQKCEAKCQNTSDCFGYTFVSSKVCKLHVGGSQLEVTGVEPDDKYECYECST